MNIIFEDDFKINEVIKSLQNTTFLSPKFA